MSIVRMKDSTSVDISVVIPVYNEEENLPPLIEELEKTLAKLGRPYEIICVDDCSRDGSVRVVKELQQKHPCLRLIRHQVNCGESAGEITGFEHAQGDIIITIDADQQNDPADIPELLDALEPDVAAVCGVRRKREDNWIKRVSSRTANAFRNMVTGDRISDSGCTFRALRRNALREIPAFNGLHRFLPTILRFQGLNVKEILVNHRPRTRGESKYGVGNRMWRGIVDCLAIRWFRSRSLPLDRTRISNERQESSPAGPVIKGIVLLFFLLIALGITYMTPLRQYLFQWRKVAEELQKLGLIAPVVFSFSVAVMVAMGCPRLIFCLIGGLAFGFWPGLLWSLVGMFFGSYATFLMARWGGSDLIRRYFPKLHRAAWRFHGTGIVMVILIRQMPVAGFLINIALGLAAVRHRDFVVGTVVGILPESILVTLIGSGATHLAGGGSAIHITLAVLGLIVVWLLSGWFLRSADFPKRMGIQHEKR